MDGPKVLLTPLLLHLKSANNYSLKQGLILREGEGEGEGGCHLSYKIMVLPFTYCPTVHECLKPKIPKQ